MHLDSLTFTKRIHPKFGHIFTEKALLFICIMVIFCILFPWTEAGWNVYSGFDTNLLYVNDSGYANQPKGEVTVTKDVIQIKSLPGSQPVVHLVTSDSSFIAEFDVMVKEEPELHTGSQVVYPLWIKLWYPRKLYEANMWFESWPVSLVKGGISTGGKMHETKTLMPYQIGAIYRVRVAWQKGESFELVIQDSSGQAYTYSLCKEKNFGIFEEHLINLSILAVASSDQASEVEVRNFQLLIPSKTRYFIQVADWRLIILTLVIVAWFIGYLLRNDKLTNLKDTLRYSLTIMQCYKGEIIVLGVTLAFVFVGYLVLATLDGHPFDRLSQETFAYISGKYGLGSIYARSIAVPDAIVRGGGVPWSAATFAYPPFISYYFYSLGKIWSAISPSFDIMRSRELHVFMKGSFGLFILLGGLVIYIVLRKAFSPKLSYGLMMLYILNPAIIFDNVIWGETDAILLLFLLLCSAYLVFNNSKMTWVFLALSLLMKQTALVTAPIIGLLALKKFGFHITVRDVGFALIAAFVVISPLVLLGYHPNVMYTSTFAKFCDLATMSGEFGMPVSYETYSFWTLLTGLQGQSGIKRLQYPDFLPMPFTDLTYFTAARLSFGLVMVIVILVLSREKHLSFPKDITFPILACVLLAFLVLCTRTASRYYTLTIPFIVLSCSYLRGIYPAFLQVITSSISFITMYGTLMHIAMCKEWVFYGLGDPTTNTISHIIYYAYVNDFVITAFSALSILSLFSILVLIILHSLSIRIFIHMSILGRLKLPFITFPY